MPSNHPNQLKRNVNNGFTLVEMLVALSIVLFLGVITFAFLPTIQDKQRVSRGASLLQGWLATAKNLALRDGLPRGVRVARGGRISGATAGGQIVITSTAHGLATGAQVCIAGVQGLTGANNVAPNPPSWTITVTGPDTFSLNGSTGAGAYTSGGGWCVCRPSVLQYLETPDNLTQGGTLTLAVQPPGTNPGNNYSTYVYTVTGTGPNIDFFGGFSGPSVPGYDANKWLVQPGDYVWFQGVTATTNPIFRVENVPNYLTDPGAGNPCVQMLVDGPTSSTSITNWSPWVIIRGPRVRQGSSELNLPENVAIDLSTNMTYGALPQPTGGQNIDIMFSPSGSVITLGMTDKIQLWLRDTSLDVTTTPLDPTATFLGEQVLVTVYAQSGEVSAQQIDPTLGATSPQRYTNPYAFTQDGRGSGL